MYRVFLKTSAKKELDGFLAKIKKKISQTIDELIKLGIHAKNTKKLQPPISGYRMRIDGYRILFDRDKEIIVIHRISKRSDAYR